MNFYEINFTTSYVFNAVLLIVLTLFVYSRNPKNLVNRLFALYSLCLAGWSFCSVFMLMSHSEQTATFWDKLCLTGVVFIPTTFFHFVCGFQGNVNSFRKLIRASYMVSIFFLFALLTPYFIVGTAPVYQLRFFSVPGPAYYLFILFFLFLSGYSLLLLYRGVREGRGNLEKQKNLLLFRATLLGYIGTSLNYNLVFRIPPYELIPYANYFLGIYGLIIAYAIVKYRLMDIRLAVTKAGLFLGVYALTLGVPFYLFAIGLKFYALLMAIALASVAPGIYSRLKKQAEDKLLEEEKAYQRILLETAETFTSQKTVDEISKSIIDLFSKGIPAKSSAFYLFDEEKFVLKNSSGDSARYTAVIPADSPIVAHLQWTGAVFADELRVVSAQVKEGVAAFFKESPAVVAVPFVRNSQVLGLLFLGERLNNALYSERDLGVFKVIADQSALAIENALYVEDLERTQEKLVESEKMATIGFLVGGLAHQLKNRLTPLVFNAEFASRKVQKSRETPMSPADCDETLGYLEKIQGSVQATKDVINGILNYASDRETKNDISVKKLVDASIELMEFKIDPPGSVIFENTIDPHLPPVKGNFAQLQEVVFNIIDNAYHSMMEKKAGYDGFDKSNPYDASTFTVGAPFMAPGERTPYQPRIVFSAVPEGNTIRLTITDNGLGVKEEDMPRLFTPLFSTKAKTKKGHGLGLYVMKQIIEKNHKGRVEFSSRYGHGVTVEIFLLT
ncbi:MAG: GAF domain-containing protein [Candidatus Omnitrophica bacterium]|nr:GAF domain-containing protein [Candidatus Omnitrophota bacterium]